MPDLTRLIDTVSAAYGRLTAGDVIETPDGPPARVVEVLEDFSFANGDCLLALLDDGRWLGRDPDNLFVCDTLPELAQRLWAGGQCHADVLVGLFELRWLSLSDTALRREAAAARSKVVVKRPPAKRGQKAAPVRSPSMMTR